MTESKIAQRHNSNGGSSSQDAQPRTDTALDRHAPELVTTETRRGNNSWETYRRWLTRVQAPGQKGRIPLDSSLYTWKGYRNWSEKVRRDWKPEE